MSKRVLLIGASTGIGNATLQMPAADGHEVTSLDVKDAPVKSIVAAYATIMPCGASLLIQCAHDRDRAPTSCRSSTASKAPSTSVDDWWFTPATAVGAASGFMWSNPPGTKG